MPTSSSLKYSVTRTKYLHHFVWHVVQQAAFEQHFHAFSAELSLLKDFVDETLHVELACEVHF